MEVKKTSTVAEVQADKTERASRKQTQPTAIESIYSFFGISPRVKQSAPSSDKANICIKKDQDASFYFQVNVYQKGL